MHDFSEELCGDSVCLLLDEYCSDTCKKQMNSYYNKEFIFCSESLIKISNDVFTSKNEK
jgi:hypothetical protein